MALAMTLLHLFMVDFKRKKMKERFKLSQFGKIGTYLIHICLIVIFISVTVETFSICERKESRNRMQPFLMDELNNDILFVGTSQVAADIMPMELWKRYGYTSYILCSTKDGIKRDRAMLELALEYTTPKLVVLNLDRYWRENDIKDQVAGYHFFSDAFPLSREKIITTREAFQDKDAQREIIFPFLTYHSRWKELTEEDFEKTPNANFLRGGTEAATLSEIQQFEKILPIESELPEGDCVEEIEKFIQKCQKEKIALLLIALPLEADAEQQRYFNGIQQLADEYGVSYLNFVSDSPMINPETDFADGAHMNISGARKMTQYLGEYIRQNYEIPNRMLEEEYVAQWVDDYVKYCDYKNERLRTDDDLSENLLLGKDENLNSVIFLDGNSACYKDYKTMNLLNNLAGLASLNQAANEERSYLAIIDYGKGEIHEFLDPVQVRLSTSFGDISFDMDDDGKPDFRLDNTSDNIFEHKGRGDIAIAFFDCIYNKKVSAKIFKTERRLTAEIREIERAQ